ncbi:unnamed protein product [Leuciscus chuanchicus]
MKIYLKAWFTCACASSAPQNDLQLLCELESYKEIHEAVAKAAMKSFSGHLWYLSEILVGLAFLDSAVSAELKSAMVTALDNKTTDHPRCIAFNSTPPQKQLSNFVSKHTGQLFTALNIPPHFLTNSQDTWDSDNNYIDGQRKSLEEYLEENLNLSYLTSYLDNCLCSFLLAGLNNAARVQLSREGPRGSVIDFVEWVLASCKSLLTVGSESVSTMTGVATHRACWEPSLPGCRELDLSPWLLCSFLNVSSDNLIFRPRRAPTEHRLHLGQTSPCFRCRLAGRLCPSSGSASALGHSNSTSALWIPAAILVGRHFGSGVAA